MIQSVMKPNQYDSLYETKSYDYIIIITVDHLYRFHIVCWILEHADVFVHTYVPIYACSS